MGSGSGAENMSTSQHKGCHPLADTCGHANPEASSVEVTIVTVTMVLTISLRRGPSLSAIWWNTPPLLHAIAFMESVFAPSPNAYAKIRVKWPLVVCVSLEEYGPLFLALTMAVGSGAWPSVMNRIEDWQPEVSPIFSASSSCGNISARLESWRKRRGGGVLRPCHNRTRAEGRSES